ncbi:UNVERIFIED_CONTAM: hypothetical protein HDU68_010876 [Siphonaria sp. JEL0065]|nr:hypothetical protein HDU68_010876 [Siphonaria sp. JEL0065]
MGNTRLYGHARIGTKTLIHEYIDEVVKQLDYLADTEFAGFSTEDKLAFFRNIQRSFGTTALLLSGGATFGMIHVGVLKALYEANALPRIISGSSAGSIVAAILCTQPAENFQAALDPHLVNRDFYEDASEVGNIFPKLYRFMNHGCVFDVEAFIKAAKANLGGDITFQEAYNKSRRVLNIAVSSSTRFEMPRLLNYLTAPNVVIWSAVCVFFLVLKVSDTVPSSLEPPHVHCLSFTDPRLSCTKPTREQLKLGIRQVTDGLMEVLKGIYS